ncbi:hypothetical protein CYY_003043 [Polysphondylium violaceum]|uniref:Actin-related protein 6 n=1 Tax=Polysphondylium violaceum TaxID=133409 RepID=A0A8J4PXV5_9MYCE|nr:hypothetical protein CYY_003043 [Polysphondylium violaceum]
MSSLSSSTNQANTTFNKVLVLDNGAYNIKASTSHQHLTNPSNPYVIIPNQVGKTKKDNKRNIIGSDLIDYPDPSELKTRTPLEKGYITNWTLEKEIWDNIFKRDELKIKPQEYGLLLTEPPFALEEVRKPMYEVVFEQYKFKSLYLATPASLGLIHMKSTNNQQIDQQQQQLSPSYTPPPYSQSFYQSPCHLVVDCGYSSTHVIPHFQNTKLNYAIKRINVGGKILTNYFKEIVSFRYWDMMHETRLMNTIKERICYISTDFIKDIVTSKESPSSYKVEYVLPDYNNLKDKAGYIRYDALKGGEIINHGNNIATNGDDKQDEKMTDSNDNDDNNNNDKDSKEKTVKQNSDQQEEENQLLTLVNERFTVPELLFNPSDIGINQGGLAEAIVQSVNLTNPNLHIPLYSNIVLMGGSSQFPGFKERLQIELRKLVQPEYEISIHQCQEPILAPLYGGIRFSQLADYHKFTVTKQEYDEHGYNLCNKRFY